MNAATLSIEQKAKITAINGNVQLIRDGFFLPAQVGMELLPGDRVVSDNSAKAVIQFTGVNDALVIEKGAAATFNLEVVEMDQAPQWIATDLFGEGVYFDSQAANAEATETSGPDLFGLFDTESSSDSTGYPVLESLVFLGATAAIYSDNEDNPDSAETATSESGSNNGSANPGTNPPDTANPPPNNPEPPPPEETAQGPLDGVLEPVTGALDGLLGATGTPSPLSTLQTTDTQANPISNLIGSIATAG
jgi:hypothetical protein